MVFLSAVLVAVLAGCRNPTPVEDKPIPQRHQPLLAQRASSYAVYTVREGDTLYSIGRRFGISVERLLTENHHVASASDIKTGQVVFIPREASEKAISPAQEKPVEERSAPSVRTVRRAALHRGRPGAAFWWPTDGKLSRRFCEQYRGFPEPGIGIEAPAGTEVCAVREGEVIACVRGSSSPDAGWGSVVVVRHSGGFVSWYALLGSITVREGQRVEKGQKVGTVGHGVAGTELAFRLFLNERCVDPLKYLP